MNDPWTNIRDVVKILKEGSADIQRVVFVSGNFNILHPGHLRLLRFAKESGDHLIVGVQSDRIAGTAAHVPERLRLEGVLTNGWVDQAFLMDIPAAEAISQLQPGIVVKGTEHEGGINPEQAAVDSYGGQLFFCSGDTRFSSLDLIQREFRNSNHQTIQKPVDFRERHDFDLSDLRQHVNAFSNLRVCVVGDLIVDEYITCDALGMSQEDPTLVVTPVDTKRFLGGAGIVAAHASGLGAKVHLVTVGGKDSVLDFAQDSLKAYGVDAHVVVDERRPTTLKQRFRAVGKTLLRVSHLRQHAISPAIQRTFATCVEDVLGQIDLLIFSDFNYGALPSDLVNWLIAAGKRNQVKMVADSQSSSQYGDVSRFNGMMFITPTEREARLSVHDFESGLVVLAERLRQRSCARNIFMTLGSEGVLIHAEVQSEKGWLTDRLPALNLAPKDIAGAGDSFLTTASIALSAGADIWQAAYLGSLGAALQVGRVGNLPLTQAELLAEVKQP